MKTILYGYQYSVYTRVAKFALAEKEVRYSYVEVDPFDTEIDKHYLTVHPFYKVPALVNGKYCIYETSAITHYVDEAFDGTKLQPKSTSERARMIQIISIIDSYGYWPMVRQVFSNRVFSPMAGEYVDEQAIHLGLEKAKTVLCVLNELSRTGSYLCGSTISLADIHLAPMIDYFQETPEGNRLLSEYNSLSAWWSMVRENSSFISTKPNLI